MAAAAVTERVRTAAAPQISAEVRLGVSVAMSQQRPFLWLSRCVSHLMQLSRYPQVFCPEPLSMVIDEPIEHGYG